MSERNLGLVLHPVSESVEDGLRICDELPPLLRQIVRYAPHNYAVGGIRDRWLRERVVFSEQQVAETLVRGMQCRTRQYARALFGPDHPQAG